MEAHRLSDPAAFVERRRWEHLFNLGLRVLLRPAGPQPETGQDKQQGEDDPEAAKHGTKDPEKSTPPAPSPDDRASRRAPTAAGAAVGEDGEEFVHPLFAVDSPCNLLDQWGLSEIGFVSSLRCSVGSWLR